MHIFGKICCCTDFQQDFGICIKYLQEFCTIFSSCHNCINKKLVQSADSCKYANDLVYILVVYIFIDSHWINWQSASANKIERSMNFSHLHSFFLSFRFEFVYLKNAIHVLSHPASRYANGQFQNWWPTGWGKQAAAAFVLVAGYALLRVANDELKLS